MSTFLNIDGHEEIEVGYLFVRKFWHQGLATEAARGTMSYAREKLGYKRLASLIRPENMPFLYISEPGVANILNLAEEIADHLGEIKGNSADVDMAIE